MKATIVNFRRGRHTQTTNQFIIGIEGIDTRAKASQFIGKKVVWKTKSGKEISGKITSQHGNSGLVRARFSKGLPGEAIGSKLEVK